MTRYRGDVRRTLSEAETLEIRLGCAKDRGSLFTSAADRRKALTALAETDEGRTDVAALIEGRALLAELRRRHVQHFAYDDDRQYPATFDSVECPRCNVAGWVPPWS